MLAAYYDKLGAAAEVLEVGEVETPLPGPGEVRVRVRASGVNPSDVKQRSGRTRRAQSWPRVIPHSDGAGEIDRIGEGVARARIGERVWLHNAQYQRATGTAAEYVVVPEALASPLPRSVDFIAGACLGVPALTAWCALTLEGSIEGQTVLVQGGAGAVGHYAVQIAKLKGARVIATVSSKDKAALAREAGADHVIDYRAENVEARVREIVPAGVERIIEVNLSTNAALDAMLLRPFGTAVVYGSDEETAPVAARRSISNSFSYRFFVVYEVPLGRRREGIAELNAWMEAGRLRHNVAARFPLARIVEAHQAVEGGRLAGNVVTEVA